MTKAFNEAEFIATHSKLSEKDILQELLDTYRFAISAAWQLNDVTLDTVNDNRHKKIIAYLEAKIKTADTEKK